MNRYKMRNVAKAIAFAILTVVLYSCEHRELTEMPDSHYVRIYLDEHIRNVSYGLYDEDKTVSEYKAPTVLRVTLCDPTSGQVMAERYIRGNGSDERGKYIDGHISAGPGKYKLMAYSFDTQSTHVRNDRSFYGMEVYTNPISSELSNRLASVRGEPNFIGKDWDIVYEPDHFFVVTEELVDIKKSLTIDTIKNEKGAPYFTASSVVQTFYIQVNITGIEYVKSAVSLITGMAESRTLHSRSMVTYPPVNVYFNMNPGKSKSRTNSKPKAIAYAYFNTFGKLENVDGYIAVTFEFYNVDGNTQVETIKLTDMFETQQVRENQWIIIDKTIEIKPPEGAGTGGMQPGVGEWKEEQGDITIR